MLLVDNKYASDSYNEIGALMLSSLYYLINTIQEKTRR
jgi:hypothetical protein